MTTITITQRSLTGKYEGYRQADKDLIWRVLHKTLIDTEDMDVLSAAGYSLDYEESCINLNRNHNASLIW